MHLGAFRRRNRTRQYVDKSPCCRRVLFDCAAQVFPDLGILCLFELASEIDSVFQKTPRQFPIIQTFQLKLTDVALHILAKFPSC